MDLYLKENQFMFPTRKSPRRKLTPRFNLPKKLIFLSLQRNNVSSKTVTQEELQVVEKKMSIKNFMTTRLDEKLELNSGDLLVTTPERLRKGESCWG